MPFLGTHLQVRPVDGFSRMMAQTTRTRARTCLFGNFSHCSPFRGSKTPKTQLWGLYAKNELHPFWWNSDLWRTDIQTDRHMATANTALAQRRAGKNGGWWSQAMWE